MLISTDDLQRIEDLHFRGLSLQAFNEAQKIGQLANWQGTDAKLLASHLAFNLGAPRSSRRWSTQAWRKDKTHPEACFDHAVELVSSRGYIPALLFLRKNTEILQRDTKVKAWFESLTAQIYASLRDFVQAEIWSNLAEKTLETEAWVWVSRAGIFEAQDRYDEALKTAEKALQFRPFYRPAILQIAHLLTLKEKYDDALGLLFEASTRIESASVVTELANLQTELGLYKEAKISLERLSDLTPMREDLVEQWLYARLSDIEYHLGNFKKASQYADVTSTKFYDRIKENLENLTGNERRVQLPVSFVRQHHMTCAPATLSAVSRYWNKPAEHLNVAEAICYNGTTSHSERQWANENDYVTREFTVNWENTIALIERKVPFTLATIHPGNGHLQAVIGFDEFRKTLLVRDPYFQRVEEFFAEGLFEEQKSSGPRGMALVPKSHSNLIADLNLDDSRESDFLFQINDALVNHKREQAAQLIEELEREFPSHRMSLEARYYLAQYDGNTIQIVECLEKLLARFPDDVNYLLAKLSYISENTKRSDLLKLLEKLSKSEKTHPFFWQMFASELSKNPRTQSRALRWLYKCLICMPGDSRTHKLLADIFWDQRRFLEATEFYRIAACANEKNEQMAYAYFVASRNQKRTDEAMAFLKDRFNRFGHKSDLPVKTLFKALNDLGKTAEAFQVLELSLKKRPDDGDLKLFAVSSMAQFGRIEEAEKLLETAKDNATKGYWLRSQAYVLYLKGEMQNALEIWQGIVKVEPLAADAHEQVAQFLAELQGKAAANEYLREVSKNHPHFKAFYKMRISWLRDQPEEAEIVVRELAKIDFADDWAHRELARLLSERKANDAALKETEIAIRLNPNDPANHWSNGKVLVDLNRINEAILAFQKAIQLSIDASYALHSWMEICSTQSEKVAALNFFRRELDIQESFGRGLIAYYEAGSKLIEPDKLYADLKQFLLSKPDLWAAWSAMISHLSDMGRYDEALDLATKASNNFPLNSSAWFDLATVYKLNGSAEKETEALNRALEVDPTSSYIIQKLTESYQNRGEFQKAKDLLENAIVRSPLDNFLHGYLAEVCWELGEKEEALQVAKRAVYLDSSYSWGWNVIKIWSEELGFSDQALTLARENAVKHSDHNSFLQLARFLDKPENLDECLAALEKAISYDATNVVTLCFKARILSKAGRMDDAFAVCRTKSANGSVPDQLRYVSAEFLLNAKKTEQGIAEFESLVKDSPNYLPAWEKLAEIYRDSEGKESEYLRMAKEMIRISPNDVTTIGTVGEAYLFTEDIPNSKIFLKKALTIEPKYEFAAFTLFDLHFRDGEPEGCEFVLEIIRKSLPKHAGTIVRDLVFNIRNENQSDVERLFENFCFAKNAEAKHFERVLKVFDEVKVFKNDFVFNLFESARKKLHVNPLTGTFWVIVGLNCGKEKFCRKALDKMTFCPVFDTAAREYMDFLIEKDRKSDVWDFVNKNENRIRQNASLWGRVGYALVKTQNYKMGVKWFADWETRKDLEPWMLWNYALVLRRTDNPEHAEKVSRFAVKLEPDHTSDYHNIFLGLDYAINGNFKMAAGIIEKVDAGQLSEWVSYFYITLQGLVQANKALSESKTDDYEENLKNMVNHGLSQGIVWQDNIKTWYFKRGFKKALTLNKTKSKYFGLRLRVSLSRFNHILKTKR